MSVAVDGARRPQVDLGLLWHGWRGGGGDGVLLGALWEVGEASPGPVERVLAAAPRFTSGLVSKINTIRLAFDSHGKV